MPSDASGAEFGRDLADRISDPEISYNVEQRVICISEDRAVLCLQRHSTRMGNRQAWIAPLGMLLTVVVALATADFHAFLGVRGAVVEAFLIFMGLMDMTWLVIALLRIKSAVSPEELVEELRGGGTRAS